MENVTIEQLVREGHIVIAIAPNYSHKDPKMQEEQKRATWNWLGNIQLCYN